MNKIKNIAPISPKRKHPQVILSSSWHDEEDSICHSASYHVQSFISHRI